MTSVFVFGSNLAGFHGAGSAKEALKKHGALWGCGIGRQGDSYAIPTKNAKLQPMTLEHIAFHIKDFLEYAKAHEDTVFNVVKIGCGLAGYTEKQIAPMFKGAPSNVNLPKDWQR